MILLYCLLLIFYIFSIVCCAFYFADKDIDCNLLTIMIVLCPILNTVLAIRDINFKETILKLKKIRNDIRSRQNFKCHI